VCVSIELTAPWGYGLEIDEHGGCELVKPDESEIVYQDEVGF
jgi:hypothetical protein